MASPYELVRVEDPAGNQFTTTRVVAENKEHQLKVLDKPATDSNGVAIPTTYRTNKAGQSSPRSTETKEKN